MAWAGREGGHLLRSGPPRNLCSGCAEQEPELVISSELGHHRAGHYQEQSSLGAVINRPDFSLQTLLVAQAGSKHRASGASPVMVGLVTALVRARGAGSAQVSGVFWRREPREAVATLQDKGRGLSWGAGVG